VPDAPDALGTLDAPDPPDAPDTSDTPDTARASLVNDIGAAVAMRGDTESAARAAPVGGHIDNASSTAETAPRSTTPRSRMPTLARTTRNPLMITAP
jgi:hypothetical protein